MKSKTKLVNSHNPEKWQTMTLMEAGVMLIDCLHSTPSASEEGYPYITIPQIKENRIDISTARLIDHESFVKWTEKALPQENDVILSRRCNPGVTAPVPSGIKCAIGQNLVLLRSDGKTVFPPFLRWLVRGKEWWGQIEKFLNVGAIFDSLRCGDIPNFSLTIPPFQEQQKISSILDSLENKIKNIQNQNEILDKITKSIFRSWFIDFDGVTQWDNSEVGKIPKGWRVKNMGKLIEFIKGKKPVETSVRFKENFLPQILIENLNGKIPLFCSPEKMIIVNETESIMVMDGASSGRIEIGYKGVIGSTLAKIIPQKILGNIYTYYFLKKHEKDINKNTTGTSVPHVDKGKIKNLNVIIPDKNTLNTFERIAITLIQKIIRNKTEINTLIIIRNEILPKLMSGEIRV